MKKLSLFALGTPWEIEAETITKNVRSLATNFLEDFEATYSRFKPGSLLNKMSRKTGRYKQGDDVMQLWKWYEKVYQWTEGIFTPMIGKNMEEIGYDRKYSLVPKKINPLPRWEETIQLYKNEVIIKKSVQLDLGGAGKGWAIDQVGKIFKQNHISDFYINAGGDILVAGRKREIMLENPLNTQEAIGMATVADESICGSAANRRNWGKYHHIFNPIKQESPKDIVGSWAVAKTAMVADTMATCAFLGQTKNLIQKIDFEYIAMDTNNKIYKSLNMPADFFYGNN